MLSEARVLVKNICENRKSGSNSLGNKVKKGKRGKSSLDNII